MRLPSSLPSYSVIVPVHVANRLAMIPRATADKFRRELVAIARLSAVRDRSGASYGGGAGSSGFVEDATYRLHYEFDHQHRALVATELTRED